MSDEIRERLQSLLERAGLGAVPPKVLLVAGVVVAILGSWAAWRWWPVTGAETVMYQAAPGPRTPEPATATTAAAAAESTTPPAVMVHVAGSVRHPGVYRIGAGSRVTDAVDAAGGLLGDAAPERVNLARQVSDGEQVLIPSEDDPAPVGGGATSGPGATPGGPTPAGAPAGGLVNINTADVTQLDSLPGVGPATAQKIIDDRTANGPFARVEDLGRVSGIGPKKLEELATRVAVR